LAHSVHLSQLETKVAGDIHREIGDSQVTLTVDAAVAIAQAGNILPDMVEQNFIAEEEAHY